MSADIASNRRAYHSYQILEKLEAGVVLTGTEIKSIRAGLANLNNAFARVEKGGVYLYDSDIQPYVRASHTQHEPKRTRKLLLHKSEIQRPDAGRPAALLEKPSSKTGTRSRARKDPRGQATRSERKSD
jgi:SsrA-binding protein